MLLSATSARTEGAATEAQARPMRAIIRQTLRMVCSLLQEFVFRQLGAGYRRDGHKKNRPTGF
jgi:hypothetical protein